MALMLLIIGVEIVLYLALAGLGAVLVCAGFDWSDSRKRKSVTHTFD